MNAPTHWQWLRNAHVLHLDCNSIFRPDVLDKLIQRCYGCVHELYIFTSDDISPAV